MGEQDTAVGELQADGVLEGFRWAWRSARAQTLRSFDPATGHDQGWLGYNAFKVLSDRLDRVFSCGRFAVDEPGVRTRRDRLLRDGLMADEFELMPTLPPDLVVRDDLDRSPGWRCGLWRILLQSFGGAGIDQIRWSQKSPTKQRVAAQPEPDQLPLPDDVLDLPMTDHALGYGFDRVREHSVTTLFVAHGIDASTGSSALYLGRSRYNGKNEKPWHWRVRLDHQGDDDRPDGPRTQRLDVPPPGGFDDAAVSHQLSSEEDSPR